MIKKMLPAILILVGLLLDVHANPAVKIVQLNGDVKVRHGLEEIWEKAALGEMLEEIDTILILEGAVVLEIRENVTFTLGSNSMLDIGDLRLIQERELYLFLMEQKVDQIKPRLQRVPLRIGNVSVVHGLNAPEKTDPAPNEAFKAWWRKETNGAAALLTQKFYPNTIVKAHKILSKYAEIEDCGEVHFYLAQSLEALGKTGQAIEAYQFVIDRCGKSDCAENPAAAERAEAARAALKQLKENQN